MGKKIINRKFMDKKSPMKKGYNDLKLALVSLDKYMNAPIGLVSIATYLEKKIGFKNTIIIDNNFDNILEKIKRHNPDIIGISSFTVNYSEAINLAKEIKNRFNKPVIIGGPHISTLPKSLHRIFDFGVIGEGEETICEILELYHDKYRRKERIDTADLGKINGLIYFQDDRIMMNSERKSIIPLDDIPIPNKKYMNKRYFDKKPMVMMGGKRGVTLSIFTSRGCPYRCIFCSTTKFWSCVRLNSAEHIFQEVKELVERYSVGHIDILDDLFIIDKKRLYQLAAMMEKSGLDKKVTFFCNLRANLVNEELLILLKRLNVKHVGFGFESGSDKILAKLKVNSVTVAQNKQAILLCKKLGFRVSGSLIFGTPGETIPDIRKTLEFMDFAIKNKVDFLGCFVLTPFPQTDIWAMAEAKHLVSNDMRWELLSMNALEDIDKTIYLNDSMRFSLFKKYYLEAKKRQNYFKYRGIINTIRYDFFNAVYKVLAHPVRTARFLLKPGVKS